MCCQLPCDSRLSIYKWRAGRIFEETRQSVKGLLDKALPRTALRPFQTTFSLGDRNVSSSGSHSPSLPRIDVQRSICKAPVPAHELWLPLRSPTLALAAAVCRLCLSAATGPARVDQTQGPFSSLSPVIVITSSFGGRHKEPCSYGKHTPPGSFLFKPMKLASTYSALFVQLPLQIPH